MRLRAGKRDKEIAAELNISVFTVRAHVANARAKLNASNRAELVSLAPI